MSKVAAAASRQSTASPPEAKGTALVWFRRDLRLDDHAALGAALASAQHVYCAFIFDTDILAGLPPHDRRVTFIWQSLQVLRRRLQDHGGELLVRHGRAREELPRLASALGVTRVFAAMDDEPEAQARDASVGEALRGHGIAFELCKDQVIFARDELLTQAGRPYTVFTPYRKAWLTLLSEAELAPRLDPALLPRLAKPARDTRFPGLEELGFTLADLRAPGLLPGEEGAEATLDTFLPRFDQYAQTRDSPAVAGTSGLAIHNRYGTVSIRRLVRLARQNASVGAQTWLTELIWREFFFQVLFFHPQAARTAFRPAYAHLAWPNDEALFGAWCKGRTGYPLVDAAMRELVATGQMHNRLRMVVASFLCKDLLIDWRWGEQFFARHLNDFDFAANNGNWQWAASTGCDAQPWFRIFNPVNQSRKFDPEGTYIRRWLPELHALPTPYVHAPWTFSGTAAAALGFRLGRDYPWPVVDHAQQRSLALALYGAASGKVAKNLGAVDTDDSA
ncbi:Deoxyribodipyrimidine photo-lyase [Burkholderiales bacterium]|nr:MAG: deoxyribodipyrimidine photo-lyase [Burkholderiales bacterium]CAG0962619.1 Deoxyribodipyrimidine photo-lyase [Burkholderiales bacterium]